MTNKSNNSVFVKSPSLRHPQYQYKYNDTLYLKKNPDVMHRVEIMNTKTYWHGGKHYALFGSDVVK